MSKYDPLRSQLARLSPADAPMTFAEIERVLGFQLPKSARTQPAWWANDSQSHVQAAAWLGAGRRTARVDLRAERVVFVQAGAPAEQTGVAEASPPFIGPVLTIPVDRLTLAGQVLIERYAEEAGGDIVEAVARALQEAANARRRALLEDIARTAPKIEGKFDAVEVIRQMREERDERILGS